MSEDIKGTSAKATDKSAKETLSENKRWERMPLHRCKEIIAEQGNFVYSDLSKVFDEARLDDARYYARRFDNVRDNRRMRNIAAVASPFVVMCSVAAGGGSIGLTLATVFAGLSIGAGFAAWKEGRQTTEQVTAELSRHPRSPQP